MSGAIMAGGGVNAQIPLETGQQQTNPLASTGQLVNTLAGINQLRLFPGQMQLQQQQVQGGAASLAAHLNQVGANAMLPALTDPNLTMERLTHYAAGAEAVANGTTQGVLAQVGAIPFAPDTPQWSQAVRQIIASQAQVNPEGAVAQVAGVPHEQQTANGIVSGVTAPATAGGGFSGAVTTPMGVAPARISRPATAADVAANSSLTLGQMISGVLPGQSGMPTPAPSAGALGPGGYRAPTRPLDQLGPSYAPPGGAAPPRPTGPPPGAAPAGSIVMRGPKGAFMVAPDKVAAFRAAGYQ